MSISIQFRNWVQNSKQHNLRHFNINLFISFVGQTIQNHGCTTTKLMLSGLPNVGPNMAVPYRQPVGSMTSAVR